MDDIEGALALILNVAVLVVIMRWVSSELTPWSALARRFATTNTPLRAAGRSALPGGGFALRSRTGPGGVFRHRSPIQWLLATPEGLQLQAGWLYGWRTRRALVPWSEILLVARRTRFGDESFELRLTPGAHLQVSSAAFEEMRPFLRQHSERSGALE